MIPVPPRFQHPPADGCRIKITKGERKGGGLVVERPDWAALKRRYDEEGYLVFPRVLDPELVRLASEHVEWLRRKNPELRPEQLHHWLMWEDPFWVRLVADSRLLDLVQPILGPNIALFASHY